MPDKDGKLTPEDVKKVDEYLAKYSPGGEAICPICRSTNWYLNERLVQPVTLGPALGMQIGGVGYPQVMLNSNPCGYTMFINAVMLGIVGGSQSEETQPAPKQAKN